MKVSNNVIFLIYKHFNAIMQKVRHETVLSEIVAIVYQSVSFLLRIMLANIYIIVTRPDCNHEYGTFNFVV